MKHTIVTSWDCFWPDNKLEYSNKKPKISCIKAAVLNFWRILYQVVTRMWSISLIILQHCYTKSSTETVSGLWDPEPMILNPLDLTSFRRRELLVFLLPWGPKHNSLSTLSVSVVVLELPRILSLVKNNSSSVLHILVGSYTAIRHEAHHLE